MSAIQEALNRAHIEGDNRYIKYSGILSPQRKKERPFQAKAPVWISMILIITFIGLGSYSSMGFGTSHTRAQSENPDKKPPQPIEQASKDGATELFDKGKAFHKSGLLEDAKRVYVETLRIDPEYVKALNNLGVIFIHTRDFRAARINFEKAIRLKPGYVDPYYNLACLFALKGEVSQSISHLKRGVAIDQSVKDWARHDTDLRNLWGVPGFQALIKESSFSLDSTNPEL